MNIPVNAQLGQRAKAAAEALMSNVKGIRGVVVSTEDGFELAACVENTAQVARLSAMASSLAALGAMAGEESNLGRCESMVMQASEGYVAIVQVQRTDMALILSVVAGSDAVLGQVLYHVKNAARTLIESSCGPD